MKRIHAGVGLVLLLGLMAHPAAAQTGELRVLGGLASAVGSGGLSASPVGIASFSFVKSRFSLGPEVQYAFGTERIFGIGGVARLRVGSGRVGPYLVGGLGGNYWHTRDFGTAGLFTGSLGAGVTLSPGSPAQLIVEARLHKNLQRYGGTGNWDFITVAAGARFGW